VTRHGVGLTGTQLEQRYRVDSLLARGGMSTVYRGLDTRLDRPVAIKVMDPRFSADRSFIDRFEREARAAARLHHPHVVAVYDQGVDGEDVFLVMELVNGGTLRDLLRREGALPAPVALSVLEPVLSALAAAHGTGLVHRDIKPENVLIGDGGVVKVADFGLVRAIAGTTTTNNSVILGTVAYLSPEQVTTGVADARSDVYAAGLVLYELLTGQPPFSGDTALSVAYRHVNEDVPAPSATRPAIPGALDELVLRATRRDPALRQADAREFLAELERVRSELGVLPTQVPVPVPETVQVPAASSSVDLPTDRVARSAGSAPSAESGHNGSGPRDPAGEPTLRRLPVIRPSPIGPQGTRAIARAEIEAAAHAESAIAPPERPVHAEHHLNDPFIRERVRRRRAAILWLIAVLLLATTIGVAAWWLGSGRWTAVPNVEGIDHVVAEQQLRAAYLAPKITEELNNTVPAGAVIRTDPVQGQKVLRGAGITVVVSKGKPTVPNVAQGVAPSDAGKAIRDAGLVPRTDDAANQFSDTVPNGTVLALNPGPGTRLDGGGTVTIVLSKGPAPKAVPNVVGKTKDEAFTILKAAGFQPSETAEFSDKVDGGHVISTSPAAGTTVPATADKHVTVVVSNTVTLPEVGGQRLQDAQATLQKLGLQVTVQDYSFGQHRQDLRVVVMSPGAGTRVQPNTTVTLAVF
jgi:serine/threonine-protein kinase